ncbi:MAG: uracil-DNA glycosylase, partial [Alphaproteobacteria bacterium]
MINVLPDKTCDLCPRLCDFHAKNRQKYPSFHNAPVPSFGSLDAEVLVVGLAPGLKGANQTGRPFTGDYAGLILYQALLVNGFARGQYKERADDGLQLVNCRITNAVRCVPPENKPEPSEIKQCNQFLKAEIAAMPNLRVILSLGVVSHNAVLRALGQKLSAYKFTHGAVHILHSPLAGESQSASKTTRDAVGGLASMPPTPNHPPHGGGSLHRNDSKHSAPDNHNTGPLKPEMLEAVGKQVK